MIACPECGAEMVLRETTKYFYPNGDPRKFYGCSRWPECNSTHGAHPDGKPLGVPANKETKEARIAAHAAFDGHWQELGLQRNEGYRLLRDIMGMSKEEAHIANFDKEQCQQLIDKIKQRRETPMVKGFKGVTFSGADCETEIGTLVELQGRFPYMEIGVLWSLSKPGTPRYPDRKWVEKASELGLRFSLHLCGKVARTMVEGTETPEIPGSPQRIQVNCNGMRGLSGWFRAFHSINQNANRNFEYIIQAGEAVGAYWVGRAESEGHNVSPLFDKSGGRGVETDEWPAPLACQWNGYAGGIGPDNVQAVVKKLGTFKTDFWIDMESRIRTGDKFDLDKVIHVLNLVDTMIER